MEKAKEIIKSTLSRLHFTDTIYTYIAAMVKEENPQNVNELKELIADFLEDTMAYQDHEKTELCQKLIAQFQEIKFLSKASDSLVAQKLNKPIVLNELENAPTQPEDAFIGVKKNFGNYNPISEKMFEDSKRRNKKKKEKDQDALDAQMQEFNKAKASIPKPVVMHDHQRYAKDINISNITIQLGGRSLLETANLRIVYGEKYGLIGKNGIGKTTLLNYLCSKVIEGMPKDLHVTLVEQEIEGDDISPLQHVLNCDVERTKLLNDLNHLQNSDIPSEKSALAIVEITKRLSDIQANQAEARAYKILVGLGFPNEYLQKPTKELSGGWKMRVSLAQALYSNPDLLLLDEPTNHLDIETVMWLENYLLTMDSTVIVVSHAREFLNNVARVIIHFENTKLEYYKGNYYDYEKIRCDLIKIRKRQKEAQDKQIEHIQEFIDKFRYNAKRASLVQSRIKQVQKIEIIEEICEDAQSVFIFPQITDTLKAPLLLLDEAVIGYDIKKPIIKDTNISIDLESRIAIVGPNGAGKTTLLKALIGDLQPMDGMFYKHNRLRIAFFTQMHVDQLDLKLSALEQMQELYPEVAKEVIRTHLGSFGLSGHLALRPMYLLSGGQKSRVVFAMITYSSPHIILMDEPTNHLDIDAINALTIALSTYNGGLVIVSHDQYFIGSLCSRIFIVKNQKLKEFKGDFVEYRNSLIKPAP